MYVNPKFDTYLINFPHLQKIKYDIFCLDFINVSRFREIFFGNWNNRKQICIHNHETAYDYVCGREDIEYIFCC